MFELESVLKAFEGDDLDIDIVISIESAREIAESFKVIRTALRRIISLDAKNIPKYAQQIAKEGLAASNG